MCQVLHVSRSGYYAWAGRPPSTQAVRRQDRLARIRTVYAEAAGRYGSPKITAVLRRAGDRLGVKTVAQLMRQAGLRARVARRYKATTDSGHGLPVADNVLARRFTAAQPPATWMADITYVATDEGWLYLASLEDLATRQIVGWAVDARMTQDLVLTALDRAVARHRPPAGVLHHSDRGSQYAAAAYQARLARYGMTPSMSRKGNCWDNACIGTPRQAGTKQRVRFPPSQDLARQEEASLAAALVTVTPKCRQRDDQATTHVKGIAS